MYANYPKLCKQECVQPAFIELAVITVLKTVFPALSAFYHSFLVGRETVKSTAFTEHLIYARNAGCFKRGDTSKHSLV